MKTLYVGDPHCTVEEIPDCTALMGLVWQEAMAEGVDQVIILGDLHNNFAVTNVHVTDFWRTQLKKLAALCPVIALVGNHDMLGNGQSRPHALVAYDDIVTVIDTPTKLEDTLYIPYLPEPNLFHRAVAGFPLAKRIVCHQEFNGAQYDNGFFAPNGVDPGLMQVPVLSGHIHTPQRVGRGEGSVWYPGAPRWRTLSDASVSERFLYILDDDFTVLSEIATSPHVKVIHDINIKPDTAHIVHMYARKDEYRIRVEGTAAFVKAQLAKLAEYEQGNKKISTNITDSRVVRVRESDGIDVAFQKYVTAFKPKNGTQPEALTQMAANRL
jgi:DNA repair exonuclease SbcCD nuclease subunit